MFLKKTSYTLITGIAVLYLLLITMVDAYAGCVNGGTFAPGGIVKKDWSKQILAKAGYTGCICLKPRPNGTSVKLVATYFDGFNCFNKGSQTIISKTCFDFQGGFNPAGNHFFITNDSEMIVESLRYSGGGCGFKNLQMKP
ncbi:MAG: hypothetical protein HQK84_07590 [Nitrospinae bacterium]|nr:hypothetical protein [Nitrospinota bacterium]